MNNKFKFLILLLFLTSSVFVYSYLVQKPKNILTGMGAIPGDVNGDGVVDIIDFQLLSNSFGKTSGQNGYNVNADFNHDNVVDIIDFQVLSNNFGSSSPTSTPLVTISPTPSSGRLIYSTDFEINDTICTSTGCKINNWPVRIDKTGSNVTGYLAIRSTNLPIPPKSGTHVLEVHGEKFDNSNVITRAELDSAGIIPLTLKTEYWIGYAIYLPNDGGYNFDSKLPEILQQDRFIDDSCTGSGGSPSFALRPQYGRWRLDIRWDRTYCHQDGQQIYETELGPQVRGVWTNFVERLYFSPDNDGVIEIWKWEDGNPIPQLPQLIRNGPNYYHNSKGPYFKLGFYKSAWANSSDVSTRTVYYDNLKVYQGTNGFNFVKP